MKSLLQIKRVFNRARMRFSSLALTWALVGCSHYAKVTERSPILRPFRAAADQYATVESHVLSTLKLEDRDPGEALGQWLVIARDASRILAKNPGDAPARDRYNFAVAGVFGALKKSHQDPWTHPLKLNSTEGEFTLTHKPDPRPGWNPSLFEFTPADRFDISGTYLRNRTTRSGIGAPLVAVGREQNTRAKQDFTMPRIYYGVTAVIHFEGKKAIVAFEDPLSSEDVTFQGHTLPLAADFTVPIAVMLSQSDHRQMEIQRLLHPDKYAETARIARLQPYDPNKTVVLVIHGLKDSPATWAPMINALRGDPQIRKNYQFWFYSYPSGYPYPYSAAILRHQLDAIGKRFHLQKKMVVIGHSMGGCISRLLITDTGDKLWMDLMKKKPEEVSLSKESRRLFTDALFFEHRPEVGRVIFIAAPLKGSDLAGLKVVRWVSGMISSPTSLLTAGAEMLKVNPFSKGELELKRIPDSVDTLTPNNRFVMAINRVPITRGIPYHTIIGDRGKGDGPDSSDGIVPYWSSHMPGAVSEKIVPSGHSAHQDPQAIEEVRRILYLNAHCTPSTN
jgi:pimeloyl-ACP methyl ester carboxylesterase